MHPSVSIRPLRTLPSSAERLGRSPAAARLTLPRCKQLEDVGTIRPRGRQMELGVGQHVVRTPPLQSVAIFLDGYRHRCVQPTGKRVGDVLLLRLVGEDEGL